MRSYYNTAIYAARFFVHLHARFNEKSKKWVEGRKRIFSKLKSEIVGKEKWVWFHASSTGEFEQGRPLMEAFRKEFPEYRILLSFFSPSGYEAKKDYKGADYICYLPIDTPTNSHRFVNILKPELAFFIKYDFWYNYLYDLNKREIPVFFVSTAFRKKQYFFKSYGKWFLKHLKKIDWFFVQNEESKNLLDSYQVPQNSVSGDTRFDRVFQLSKEESHYPLIEQFKGDSKLIVAGSTWSADEKHLKSVLEIPNLKLIIVPHELDKERIASIFSNYRKDAVVLYSALNEKSDLQKSKVLILDTMGMLSSLYRYADIAYVGGGFGAGIHNILEAAAYGKPVVFGPKNKKFIEAKDLIEIGGAFEVNNGKQLTKKCQELLEDSNLYDSSCQKSKDYVENNIGATKIIIDKVREYLVK